MVFFECRNMLAMLLGWDNLLGGVTSCELLRVLRDRVKINRRTWQGRQVLFFRLQGYFVYLLTWWGYRTRLVWIILLVLCQHTILLCDPRPWANFSRVSLATEINAITHCRRRLTTKTCLTSLFPKSCPQILIFMDQTILYFSLLFHWNIFFYRWLLYQFFVVTTLSIFSILHNTWSCLNISKTSLDSENLSANFFARNDLNLLLGGIFLNYFFKLLKRRY